MHRWDVAGKKKIVRDLRQVTSLVYFYSPGCLKKDTGIQGWSGTKTKDSDREQLEMSADSILVSKHIMKWCKIISLKGCFLHKMACLLRHIWTGCHKSLEPCQEIWAQGWLCFTSCESLGKPCNFSGAQFLHLMLDKVYCLNEIYIFVISKAVCHSVLLWHEKKRLTVWSCWYRW